MEYKIIVLQFNVMNISSSYKLEKVVFIKPNYTIVLTFIAKWLPSSFNISLITSYLLYLFFPKFYKIFYFNC